MLLEFLAQNIPHTKALMIFDSLGKLNEKKVLGNLGIDDEEIIQQVIANSKSLINLVTGKKDFRLSENQLITLKDSIVAIRRLDQNKILVILLSPLITQESEVLQYGDFVN